ncbi:MAG: hypothetical protein ABJF23_13060 [Bryobacteraceae bacterium]
MGNPHILYVARAFNGVALLLGIPSLAATLYFGFAAVSLYLSTPAKGATPSAVSANSAIDLLTMAARAAGAVFGFLGSMGEAVIRGLAAASLAVLIFSLTLFFTSRGLQAHAGWARGTAGVILTLVFLAAMLALLSSGSKSLLALLLASCSGYGLWALWKGFA